MRQITLSYIIGIFAGATLFFDVVPAFTLIPIVIVMLISACFLKSRMLQTVMLCLAFGFAGLMRMEESIESEEVRMEREKLEIPYNNHKFSIQDKIESLRSTLEYQMGNLGLEGDEFGVAIAMTLGDKDGLDADVRDVYSQSGASHVLALSGMHMAIVFAVLTILLTKFPYWMKYGPEWYLLKAKGQGYNGRGKRMALELFKAADWLERRRWVMILLSLLLLWVYILLVGMPASALRAGVMLTACSLAMLLGRVVSIIDALVLAAFFILFVSPLNLFNVGFQMSFLAVLGIALFYNRINWSLKRLTGLFPLNEERKRMKAMGIHQSKGYKSFLTVVKPLASFIIGTFALTISAQVLVLPLVAFYFHQIPCYGILSSLVVAISAVVIVWLGALLIGLVLIGTVIVEVSILQCIAKYVALCMNYAIHIQNDVLSFIASLPHSTLELHLSLARVILIYIIIGCFTLMLNESVKAINSSRKRY